MTGPQPRRAGRPRKTELADQPTGGPAPAAANGSAEPTTELEHRMAVEIQSLRQQVVKAAHIIEGLKIALAVTSQAAQKQDTT